MLLVLMLQMSQDLLTAANPEKSSVQAGQKTGHKIYSGIKASFN